MDSCDAGSRASTTTMNDEDEDENNAVVVVKKTAAKNEERRRRRRQFDFSLLLLLLLPRVVVVAISLSRAIRRVAFLFVAMDKQLKDVFFEIEKRGKTHNNITKNTTTKTKLSLSLSLLHVRPVTRVVRGTVTFSSSSFGKLSIVPVWEG